MHRHTSTKLYYIFSSPASLYWKQLGCLVSMTSDPQCSLYKSLIKIKKVFWAVVKEQSLLHTGTIQLAYCRNWSIEDTVSSDLTYLSLNHLNMKDNCVRILFIDFGSAFNTLTQQQLIGQLSWTLLSATGSWTTWQGELSVLEGTPPHWIQLLPSTVWSVPWYLLCWLYCKAQLQAHQYYVCWWYYSCWVLLQLIDLLWHYAVVL